MQNIAIPAQKTGAFTLLPQTVTWHKSDAPLKKALGPQFDHFAALHELVLTRPKKALKELQKAAFPPLPEVSLLTAYALLCSRRRKKAEALIEANYRTHPDHLLSKINYGDSLLRRGALSSFRALFEEKTDLRALYPHRKTFHITEFRGFMTLMGHYHLLIGERDQAVCFHYLTAQLDPTHPSTTTLGRKIYKKQSIWSKMFRNGKL